MKKLFFLAASLILLSCTEGKDESDGDSDAFGLSSTSYSDGAAIPVAHACGTNSGQNASPQYEWRNAPANTLGFALIMDDEVSPCGSGDKACIHWGVFNLPASSTALSQNANISSIANAVEGKNYSRGLGYAGPCPPSSHTYKTTVYALGTGMPTITSGATLTRSEFQRIYSLYILGTATISGTFTP